MNYAILRLSDSNDHTKFFDLKFKLLQHNFVKKWINCVLEAQQKQYPISEPWAIYNLNNKMNRDFIKTNINRLMKKIDNVHKLFGFELKNINDQDTLNKIHAIFEFNHGKLDAWKINPLFKNKPDSFRKNLSEMFDDSEDSEPDTEEEDPDYDNDNSDEENDFEILDNDDELDNDKNEY